MNKNEELLPYYEKAKELLSYDPKTGVFTWTTSRGSRAIKGGVAGQFTAQGYWCVGININKKQKFIKAHRLAWFITYGKLPNVIDHIDGDKMNNSLCNIRNCNSTENSYNVGISHRNNTGYKGVSLRKETGKFRSMIRVDGKLIHLGQYDTAIEASIAYKNKAKEVHGEFYSE